MTTYCQPGIERNIAVDAGRRGTERRASAPTERAAPARAALFLPLGSDDLILHFALFCVLLAMFFFTLHHFHVLLKK